jgi:galactokinase
MEVRLEQLRREFKNRFGEEPRFFQAPGRVNLIGEHTDYNDGFVMPFAIDRHMTTAAALRHDSKIEVYALDLNENATIDLDAPPERRRGSWIDYVEGTARSIRERFGDIGGVSMLITSTVPIGAGLSSSAAIEISIGLAILEVNSIPVDREKLAFAGQNAEHEYAGIRSGIMDQFASVFGKEGHAMLLDCRSLDIKYIPLANDEMSIVVIDTKVKHSLASSEYNTRRRECEQGVELIREQGKDIESLRDVTEEMLAEVEGKLPEVIARRCRHVVSENARTLRTAEAFSHGDLETAGKMMFESHRSLREDYEVSSPELDFLVDTASACDGVLGSRMTGGGFGGCTVNLLRNESVDDIRTKLTTAYATRFGFKPDVYTFHPGAGASAI